VRVLSRPDLDDGPGDGGQRNGQDRPHDARKDGAGRQGHQDHQGVQLERLAHDDRLEEVALELVDRDHHGHHDQGNHRAVRHEGHEGGEDAGHSCPHQWNEGAEENDDGQREGQRDLHDQQRRANGHGVNEGHDGGPADVAAEYLEGAAAHPAQLRLAGPAEGAQEKVPDLGAVLEEEEQDDDHKAGAGNELRDHGQAGDGAGADLAAGGKVDDSLARLVKLLLVDGNRAGQQELFQFVQA
jgi:hypothetical protein